MMKKKKNKIISSSFQGLLMIQFYVVSQTCWMNDLVRILLKWEQWYLYHSENTD